MDIFFRFTRKTMSIGTATYIIKANESQLQALKWEFYKIVEV